MRRWYIPIVLFVAFGYVILTALLLQVATVTREINFLVRAGEMVLLAVVMIVAMRQWSWKDRGLTPLMIFFFLYGVRLVYDVGVQGIISDLQSPSYLYGYYFGLTLLPIVCIGLLYRPEDGPAFCRITLAMLALGNVLLATYAVSGGTFAGGAFSGRVEEAGEIQGTAILNPLAFGLFGAMLAAALIGVVATVEKLTVRHICFVTAGMTLAFSNILFGASRGPLLALLLAIALMLARSLKLSGDSIQSVYSRRLWLLVGAIVALSAYGLARSDGDVFLLDRIQSTLEQRVSGEEESRDTIYATALNDFWSSPAVGSSYVVSEDFAMPHNIVLDSLISTGVLGTVFFFIALWRAVVGVWRLAGGAFGAWGVVLALVTTCLLGAGQTSSSIGQSPELWIFIALVTVISSGTPIGPAVTDKPN